MADDEVERTVRKLRVEHAETRWISLRLVDDAAELRQELRTKGTAQDARLDSMEAVLESLVQMVGQVLERLPEEPRG